MRCREDFYLKPGRTFRQRLVDARVDGSELEMRPHREWGEFIRHPVDTNTRLSKICAGGLGW